MEPDQRKRAIVTAVVLAAMAVVIYAVFLLRFAVRG